MDNRFEHLVIDEHDPRGHFYWNVSDAKKREDLIKGGPTSKFEAFVWLGLLPDNGILTNKLINCFGSHVFLMISELADSTDSLETLKKIILGSEGYKLTFEQTDQIELLLCWRMVAKFRVLQLTDEFHNNDSIRDEIKLINDAKNALKTLYKISTQALGKFKNITDRENSELEQLEFDLDILRDQLLICFLEEDSNTVIQDWQRKTFKKLIDNFRNQQNSLALHQSELPLANRANTFAYQNADYEIQEHIFNERTPISKTMLWQTNTSNCVFHSADYPGCDPKRLLLGANIIEALGIDLSIKINDFNQPCSRFTEMKPVDASNHWHAIRLEHEENERQKPIRKVQVEHAHLVATIAEKTLHIKKNKNHDEKKLKELKGASYLWRDFLLLCSPTTPLERGDELVGYLNRLKKPKTSIESKSEKTEIKYHQETKLNSYPDWVSKDRTPQPISHDAYSPGDALSSLTTFAAKFFLYFDREQMAKRPFVSFFFFNMIFIEFGLLAIGTTNANPFLPVAQFISTLQSKLLFKEILPQQITDAIVSIDEYLKWVTNASDPFKEYVFCGLPSSTLIFNLMDYVFNNLLRDQKQNSISELIEQYSNEGLEGFTALEEFKKVGETALNVSLMMTASIVLGIYIHIYKIPVANFFIDVTPDNIFHPTLQTIGSAKAGSLFLGKMAGIYYFIKKGELLGIHGETLKPDEQSVSREVIMLFTQLVTGFKIDSNFINDPNFIKIREHFEILLSKNPFLLQTTFKDSIEKLDELGVRRIHSKWYHHLGMAVVRTVIFGIGIELGLLVGFLSGFIVSLSTGLIAAALPYLLLIGINQIFDLSRYPLARLCMTVPLNWVTQAALAIWTMAKAVIHPLPELVVRTPEIAVTLLFAPIRLVVWTASLALPSLFSKAVTDLNDLKNASVEFIRQNVRYPLKDAMSSVLKWFRDKLIREPQRALQRSLIVKPISTSNAKIVKQLPVKQNNVVPVLQSSTDKSSFENQADLKPKIIVQGETSNQIRSSRRCC